MWFGVQENMVYITLVGEHPTFRRIWSFAMFAFTSERHAIITVAFIETKALAISNPIPELQPVII